MRAASCRPDVLLSVKAYVTALPGVPFTWPVLLTLKRVVLTHVAVDEPMAKSVGFMDVLDAYTESTANGELVPTPTVPEKLALANCEVEDAWMPCVKKIGVEVELASAPKFVVGVKAKALATCDGVA